jgi:hypothetical protein
MGDVEQEMAIDWQGIDGLGNPVPLQFRLGHSIQACAMIEKAGLLILGLR